MAVEVTYSTIAQIDTFAQDNGRPEWEPLSDDEKVRANTEATQDIIMHHKQVPVDSTLFEATDVRMIKANNIQAIFIARNQGFRDQATQINAGVDGPYSDGVLGITHAGNRKLDEHAKFLVDQVMLDALEFGIFSTERDLKANTFKRS